MFCYKCGKKIKDTAKFCNACGSRIPLFDDPQTEDPLESAARSVPLPAAKHIVQFDPVQTSSNGADPPSITKAENNSRYTMQWKCENCGTVNTPDDMFCANCLKNREKSHYMIINYNRQNHTASSFEENTDKAPDETVPYPSETVTEASRTVSGYHVFCRKCGKELKDTAKFCNACGWKISERNDIRQKGNDNI